jgi:PilX N-terminal
MRIRTKEIQRSLKLKRQVGFVLIGVLLLLLLVSAIAVTVAYTVNSERHISGSDEEGNLSYYAAEAGMEKMTADLATLFNKTMIPTPADIANLGGNGNQPVLPGIDYSQEYVLQWAKDKGGNYIKVNQPIKSGPYAGLQAQIIPINLFVTATRDTLSSAQTRMTRQVEVGLIPVFQFGVFSEKDLSFFPGPPMEFNGRVHTNGNLFITANSSNDHLVFHDKVTAAQDVIVTQLANTFGTGKANGKCYSSLTPGCTPPQPTYEGPVYIATTPGTGCPIAPVLPPNKPKADATTISTSCTEVTTGSLQANLVTKETKLWKAFSTGTANSMILNADTGATTLTLPFVQNGVSPIEIIRQPAPLEDASSALGQSRLFNEAQIRVLLTDTEADMPVGDPTQDVWLDNTAPTGAAAVGGVGVVYTKGVTVTNSAGTATGATYFANGTTTGGDPDWTFTPVKTNSPTTWPLIGGWLRVEARKSDGSFRNVTQEWMTMGFARGAVAPDSEHGKFNPVHPDAILIFQKIRQNLGHALQGSDVGGSGAQYNWYPTNIYDAREGISSWNAPNSKFSPSGDNCPIAGAMNVVELDVRNLQRWLMKQLPEDPVTHKVMPSVTDTNLNPITTGTGDQVENTSQNGYILYFSDRRGMLPDTSPKGDKKKHGDWGYPQQAQDINENGSIEKYGANNIADGFFHTPAPDGDPTLLISCQKKAQKYPVSGARHALKVMDGSSGNLPGIFDISKPTPVYVQGGFTVASEQPVYLIGNYNSLDGDGFPNAWTAVHVPSAVIADAVTLLSQGWTDDNDFNNPLNQTNRPSTESRFRVAIAAGKNVTFNIPGGAAVDYGTDGGVHNFLRYLEDWNNSTFSHYRGSMVSFYYSHYGTGAFKSDGKAQVYTPPARDYSFDDDFKDLTKMPPGTPHLLNITNLAYHQDFTPK